MWSTLIPAKENERDLLSADLWEAGTLGILEEPGGLRAFFGEAQSWDALKRLFPAAGCAESAADFSPAPPLDYEPILAGERFFIAHPLNVDATPAGRMRLTLDASTAFGSGRHESTQLCIEALEKHLLSGATVLDVGCGSGVLSAAARMLGAGRILSCDIHEESLANARKHVANALFAGSADCVKSAFADLTLANISTSVLDRIAFDLRRVTKPDGLIIIAGFIAANPPKRFAAREAFQKADWLCWICRPEQVACDGENLSDGQHPAEWWL